MNTNPPFDTLEPGSCFKWMGSKAHVVAALEDKGVRLIVSRRWKNSNRSWRYDVITSFEYEILSKVKLDRSDINTTRDGR